MDEPERCGICGRVILRESHGGPKPSAGDHEPAYHVAQGYHQQDRQRGTDDDFSRKCISCDGLWPCPTISEFGRQVVDA